MSSWLTKTGTPQGFHDIDTEIDSATADRLPLGMMQHHAFQPHLWRRGDRVLITTADDGRYEGECVDVSMRTGNILILLQGKPGKPWTP